MDRTIKADLFRYDQLSGNRGFRKGLTIPGFRFMYIFRKLSAARKNSLSWLFYSYLKHRYSFKYGFQIPKETKIGEGLFLGHFGTVVINGDSVIGKNCNIAHCVTIGQVNTGRFKGCPKIGDKVWIGTGAVLVGKIVVGSDVLIAPNSYVNFDVPKNSLVIGNPAKIIPRENPSNGYINNIWNE